jgi:hypothetical protein
MTKKITLGVAFAAVFAIGAIGILTLSSNMDQSDGFEATQNNLIIQKAYAESPNHMTVTIQGDGGMYDTEYGFGSGFDIETIECKIFTKNGAMDVTHCKAIGFIDRENFFDEIGSIFPLFSAVAAQTIIQNEMTSEEELIEDLFECIFTDPSFFDACVVEYEVERLTYTLGDILDDKGYVVPEDYEEKSVELEMSIQNDGGSETPDTKVVVTIEY